MDVAKVQKLNDMAVNLSRHNIVGSREDAIDRAAQIYGNENNFSRPSVEASYESSQMQQDLSKDVRKLTFALQNLMNQFGELKISHTKLEKNFNDFIVGQRRWEAPKPMPQQNVFTEAPKNFQPQMQSNFSQGQPQQQGQFSQGQFQPQQQFQQNQFQQSQGMSEAQARLMEAMAPAQTKSTRNPNIAIDRNNVAPNDVSIEKFFYAGRK